MEFKGTKGKWGIFREDIIITEAEIEDDVICIKPNLMQSQKNWKANALLISKAPEMLEMLNKVCEKLKGNGFPMLQNEIQQLIKEATTI